MELKVSDFPDFYDVVVIGGGVSGCHAAIAAGRAGAKVLIVEESGALGGALTNMGVGPMMTFHNRAGEQLIFGTPQEMVDRLVSKGGSTGHIPDSTGYCSTVTPFDAEILKVTLDEMVAEAGVTTLFHTVFISACRNGQTLDYIIIHNSAGLQHIRARIFIDSTGDADVAASCGLPCIMGRENDHKVQPLTMNARFSGVDSAKFRRYITDNWEQFDDPKRGKDGIPLLNRTPRISLWGMYDLWRKAKENHEVSIPRENVLFFETNTPGEFIFNTSRIHISDPMNPTAMSRAENEGRRQVQELAAFLKKNIPGFENSKLAATPARVGIRESRHPITAYVMNAEDVVSQRKFTHPVVLGGYPIDIHSPEGQKTKTMDPPENGFYQIPMESLLFRECRNLIMSGRAIGADHFAGAAVRVSPIAMATGQAAGAIAGILSGSSSYEVDYGLLKEILLSENVKL